MPSSLNGTGITFSNGSTQSVAATGTVTSVATGNGLSGGTITATGTLVIACPGFNTVGSYCYVLARHSTPGMASGTVYSAGTGNNQIKSTSFDSMGFMETNNLSGTWRWLASPTTAGGCGLIATGIACRVA